MKVEAGRMKDYINTFREKVKRVKVRTKRFVEAMKEFVKEMNVEVVDIFKEVIRLEESNLILVTRNKVLEQALIRVTEARKLEEKGNVGKKKKKQVKAGVEENKNVKDKEGKEKGVEVDQELDIKGEKGRQEGNKEQKEKKKERKMVLIDKERKVGEKVRITQKMKCREHIRQTCTKEKESNEREKKGMTAYEVVERVSIRDNNEHTAKKAVKKGVLFMKFICFVVVTVVTVTSSWLAYISDPDENLDVSTTYTYV